MRGHEGAWCQQPDKSGSIGQYYCSKCKLTLEIGYNQNRDAEACTGWYWQIIDSSSNVVAEAGNKHAPKYEFDVDALDEVRREGLLRFDSVPCQRSN